jgi:DNA end-binding protein Ku
VPEVRAEPRRARPLWSGSVAFGLVTLPVSLYPANRTARASLRMVDREGTPLARRYFAPGEDDPLEPDEIVRGYPVEDERFVIVEDEELEALAPEKSQEIDLSRFVALDEVDPSYFQRGYFLAPDRGALKAYRLLAKSMEEAGRAGIATFVMRDKEYLVAIIAEEGILRAETLRFHDELRAPEDVGLDGLAEADEASVAELLEAIERLGSDELDRSLLEDEASRRLRELVAEKLATGDDVVELPTGTAPGEDGEEIDLMQVLKESLAQDEEEDADTGGSPRRTTRGAPSSQSGRAPRAGSGSEASPAELGRRTKAALYERARELGIEGRSGMSKQELIDAIAGAA